MKKIVSLICLISIALSVLGFTSCGFFDEETGKIISRIEKTAEFEDGSSEITIYYTDPYYPPETFKIPAGKQGYKGNGIIGFSSKDGEGEDEGKTIVTITLENTDEDGTVTTEDKIVKIPDGKTITSIDTGTNSVTGEEEIIFTFNNGDGGTLSIPMPKLNGVEKMELVDDENGGYALKVKYTLDAEDAEMTTIGTIKAPVGIDHVEGNEEDGQYVLYVYYTDGSVSNPITFDKPSDPNTWWSFDDLTDDTPESKVGDFCFVKNESAIYQKVLEDGRERWTRITRLATETTDHTVTFYRNDGTDQNVVRTIKHGQYFGTTPGKLIPIPEKREGYEFVGWYAVDDYQTFLERQAVISPFTDLTPVNSNMTLYAIWAPIDPAN